VYRARAAQVGAHAAADDAVAEPEQLVLSATLIDVELRHEQEDDRQHLPGIVWPVRVRQPARPPALVYLDLNHYINFARTAAGDATVPAGYDELLGPCRDARQDGRALFPLSAAHYVEMSKILDPAQRKAVAALMEELSDFNVLLGRSTLAALEIESMLDVLLGHPTMGESVPLLGSSGVWAFGLRGELVLCDADGNDFADQTGAVVENDQFAQFLNDANRFLERALLTGPSDAEIADLRARGYAPEKAHEVTARRAQQERDQALRLDVDPRWRRGRLRDVIGARELRMEWSDVLTRAVMARGLTVGEVVSEDRDTIRAFAEGMPSSLVAITLKTRYHRDGNHRWTTNDIHDIDALAVAVPYCDAVFTDKAAWNALTASAELRPLNTFLPRRPGDLTDWINDQPIPAT